MSIVFTESFDKYGTTVAELERGVWTDAALGTSPTLVAGAGRCGTTVYQNTSASGAGPSVGLVLGDQFSVGHIALKRLTASGLGDDIVLTEGTPTTRFFFSFLSNGAIQFWTGNGRTFGVFIAQSDPGVIQTNQWFVLEWEVLANTVGTGTAQVWFDGAEIIPLQTGLTIGNYNRFHAQVVGGGYQIDDVVLMDGVDSGIPGFPNNAHLGPVHVTGQVAELDSVAGGGFYKQFTPSSGTDHGAMVDDNPPDDDTTFNLSAAATNHDTYTFPDIKIGSGSVFAVNVMPRVKKSDAMNARNIKPMFRSAAVDTIGVSQAVPDTQYGYRWEIFEGVGGAAWSVSSVNAAEYGLQDFS